jgi:hypothetical protein
MQPAVMRARSGRGRQDRVGGGWRVNRYTKLSTVGRGIHQIRYLRCKGSQLGVTGVGLGGGLGSRIDGIVA